MKNAKIVMLILHSIIVIGIGHGLAILLIFDIICIPTFIAKGFEKSPNDDFRNKALLAGLFSLIGKSNIIISLLIEKPGTKNLFTLFGIMLMYVALGILIYGDWVHNFIDSLPFFTGIPFLVFSVRTLYLMYMEKIKTQ